MCANRLQSTLRHWPPRELPVDLNRLHLEMALVGVEMAKDVPLVHAGFLSSADVVDNIGHRGQLLQGVSEAVLQKFGGGVPDDSRDTHGVPAQEISAAQ